MWVQFREEENPNGTYGKMYCIDNRNVEVGIQQIRIVGQGTTEYVKFPSDEAATSAYNSLAIALKDAKHFILV